MATPPQLFVVRETERVAYQTRTTSHSPRAVTLTLVGLSHPLEFDTAASLTHLPRSRSVSAFAFSLNSILLLPFPADLDLRCSKLLKPTREAILVQPLVESFDFTTAI